jgi:tetratricopeptide repeat protein
MASMGTREGLDRAERLLNDAQPTAALHEFTAVLAVDSGSVEARCGLVRALWADRAAKQALHEMDKIGEDRANDPAVRIARGTLALGLPDHPLQISIGYGSGGRDAQMALAQFEAAVEATPQSIAAWRGIAMTHRLEWRYDDAHRTIDAGLACHPGSPALRIQRAWCLDDSGRLEDARAEISAVLAGTP